MEELIQRLWRRVITALTTWPSGSAWLEALGVAVATLALMLAIGFAGGLYHLQPTAPGLAQRMLLVLFVPALGEELTFRALLTPGRAEQPSVWRSLVPASAAFTLWHVVEALVVLPKAASLFLRPDFLACACVLGIGCGLMRWRSGSVWPAVALHWLVVVGWQTWLGGPGFKALS